MLNQSFLKKKPRSLQNSSPITFKHSSAIVSHLVQNYISSRSKIDRSIGPRRRFAVSRERQKRIYYSLFGFLYACTRRDGRVRRSADISDAKRDSSLFDRTRRRRRQHGCSRDYYLLYARRMRFGKKSLAPTKLIIGTPLIPSRAFFPASFP